MGRYASILSALVARIEGHRAEGGLLAAYKFEQTPIKEPEGQKDLPVLRLWLPDINEAAHAINIVDGTFGLKLTISCARKLGLVALMEQVEIVIDTIETDPATGETDLSLSNTLARPMIVQVKDSFILDLSSNVHIYISALPKAVARGRRRF